MIGLIPLHVTALQAGQLALHKMEQTPVDHPSSSRSCYINNDKYSCFLQITQDEPQFSVKWGNKMLIKEANKPFSIEHPLLSKYTFKITNVRPKLKPISIFEWLKTR